jgi:hypothetical protein
MPLCLTGSIDIPDKQRFTKSRFFSLKVLSERAAVSSAKKVSWNRKKRLTAEGYLANMPFCLRREKVVCEATEANLAQLIQIANSGRQRLKRKENFRRQVQLESGLKQLNLIR